MIKKCAICGKEFESKSTTKTCSIECRKQLEKQYKRKYLRKHVKPKLCKACGKEFYPTVEFRGYCSAKCQASTIKVGRETCIICGTPLIGRNASTIYCSKQCSYIAKRRQTCSKYGEPEIAEIRRASLVDDINTQAREKGVSYGVLQARRYIETHKYNILEGK